MTEPEVAFWTRLLSSRGNSVSCIGSSFADAIEDGGKRNTDHFSNSLLEFSTPVLDARLAVVFTRELFHARALAQPTMLAEQLLHRRARALGRA